MKSLQWLAAGLIVGLVGAGARAEDKPDYAKLIVGKWEASKVDEGTLPPGAIVEFTKDGKIKLTGKKGDAEMAFEGTYTVEKDTFTIAMKVGDQEHKQTITITKISDSEMATKNAEGKVVELKRKK
jgi:uncharacterized protein (TIGR03066 family)